MRLAVSRQYRPSRSAPAHRDEIAMKVAQAGWTTGWLYCAPLAGNYMQSAGKSQSDLSHNRAVK